MGRTQKWLTICLQARTSGDLRWWSFLFTATAVQKTCTKTYGRKGVRSGGHHLLIFSHFFRSNKKKSSLILSHFDSVKAPENISIMSQLLSEEHYRLCFPLYIHNMQTFTICHFSVVDGILYSLPRQKRTAAENYISVFKSPKKHSLHAEICQVPHKSGKSTSLLL